MSLFLFLASSDLRDECGSTTQAQEKSIMERREPRNKRKIHMQSPPSSWTWTRILAIRGLLLGVCPHVCVLLYINRHQAKMMAGVFFPFGYGHVPCARLYVCILWWKIVRGVRLIRRNAYIVVWVVRMCNTSVHSNRGDTCAFPHCCGRNTKKPLAYSSRHRSAYIHILCCNKDSTQNSTKMRNRSTPHTIPLWNSIQIKRIQTINSKNRTKQMPINKHAELTEYGTS